MEQNRNFDFTYSAAQQQEIENIRKKYLPKEENKMDRLRKLHHSASRMAKIASITLGTVGTLILGCGMSLIMTELGTIFGQFAMPIGIITGIAGLILIALAYPIYNRVLKKERERIAPEILRLIDELAK
jgi:hypothetical protein